MILYHGSNIQIDIIELSRCNRFKDFGQAFYLSTDKKQAEEIAQARADFLGGSPIVNSFEFDEQILSKGILNYKQFQHYGIEWAQFVSYLIPEEYLKVSITLEENGNRRFVMEAYGSEYETLLEEIR